MDGVRRYWKMACLLMALLLLFTGCGNKANGDMAEKLTQMQQNLLLTEPVCEKLVEIANLQIDSAKAYWEEYDNALASGAGMEEYEDNYDEVKAQYDELLLQIDTLASLESSYRRGKPTEAPSFNRTEEAYVTCLAEIRQSADDMKTVFDYYFDVREALKPMEEFTFAENTTGYTDYALMAGQLSQVVSQTQRTLKDIQCPAYMQNSHDALCARIEEFQGFSQDFSIAVQLGDPLRIASCGYRSDRIDILLTQGDRNLDDDFTLQFEQAANRLNGRVATLRSELQTNIEILLDAVG